MNIEELVAGLKEKGMDDAQIREELEGIVAQIQAILNPQEAPAEEPAEEPQPEETEEEHSKRVFGL